MVFLLVTRKTEKVNIDGLMVKYMMVSGKMGKNMEAVYGEELGGIHTLESGNLGKLMDLEYISGLMETDMKESLKII